jgi:hypothetical protein
MIVDIHLDELDLAAGLAHRRFNKRRQLLARPAPRRPEIDQHRLVARIGDHVLLEIGGCRVLDQIACRRANALRTRRLRRRRAIAAERNALCAISALGLSGCKRIVIPTHLVTPARRACFSLPVYVASCDARFKIVTS